MESAPASWDTILFAAAVAAGLAAGALRQGKAPTPALAARQLGAAIRDDFVLDPSVVHGNHGSFGAVPKSVRQARREVMDRIEAYPDRFFRHDATRQYAEVCEQVAAWVGAAPGSLVLVENATTGVNTALRSADLKPSDRVLCFSDTYNACRNAVFEECRRSGATGIVARLPLRIRSAAEVVARLREVLDRHPGVTLVVLDHITSPAAVVHPVRELCAECRRRGVRTIVDGAHAPGAMRLDVASIGADWYTGNLHKWAFAPRGVALLAVSASVADATRPVVTSHNWPSPWLQARFFMQGTNDQSRILSVPAAIGYLESLGGLGATLVHQRAILRAAANLARSRWEAWDGAGELLVGLDHCTTMCSVRTPLAAEPFLRPGRPVPATAPAPDGWLEGRAELLVLPGDAEAAAPSSAGAATATLSVPPRVAGAGVWAEAEADPAVPERVARALFRRSATQCALFVAEGAIWLRVSAAVYSSLADVRAVVACVTELAKETEAAGLRRGCGLEGEAGDI